jgi:hypothetical protein
MPSTTKRLGRPPEVDTFHQIGVRLNFNQFQFMSRLVDESGLDMSKVVRSLIDAKMRAQSPMQAVRGQS